MTKGIVDIIKNTERLVKNMEGDSYKEQYRGRFSGYTSRINATSEPFDPENAYAEVRLTTRDGREYEALFMTRAYMDYLFDKNKKTGENASGIYLAIEDKIDVEKITNETIKITIDELIEKLRVESFFREID